MKKPIKKILVVDDDHMLVRMLESVLKRDGYTVVTAYDGTSGLEKARKEEPLIILLDVILPDIDGKDVAKKLREDPLTKDIPIVFLTITLDVKKDKGDQRITVDGHRYLAMAKPMHTAKLLSMLRKTLNRRLHKNPDIA